jgi:hypothetical protein
VSTSAMVEDLTRQLAEVKEQGFMMAAALHTVVCESSDPESVRTGVAALMGCDLGKAYLEMHPLRY